MQSNESCRLCASSLRSVETQLVLGKYNVGYFQCPRCDLIQTERPFWLEEAYVSALSDCDTGSIERARLTVELTLSLAWLLGLNVNSTCLDYGGGHGILTRAMRDHGYDFSWHDRYAVNHFAPGFEGDPNRRQSLVTCFEVWEHLADVGVGLEKLFSPGHDFLLVGTFLHNGHREKWWYYCPEVGQHVAFFSRRTMQFVAARFGCQAIIGRRYTLFHKPELLSGWRKSWASLIVQRARPARNSRLAWLSAALRPRLPSRTWDDHVKLLEQHRQGRRRAA